MKAEAPAASLQDRYRDLLRELGVDDIAARLRQVERTLRFGKPGEAGPSIFEEELLDFRRLAEQGRTESGADPPGLLVSTVGYSPDPLFLTLAHHAPLRIVLLFGPDLSRPYLCSLGELWDRYRALLDLPAWESAELEKHTVDDHPATLFQVVRQIVEAGGEPRSATVLDITRAKKSMIAGAFLAAGFLGIEVSYVDFTSYRPTLRRPDPGSCRPVVLRHPYRLFRLKEQGRLAEAFDDRRYDEARRLAEELREMAGRREVREVLGEEEADRLAGELGVCAAIANACALWSEGFYGDARDELDDLDGFRLPPTVELLGRCWPRRDDDRSVILERLSEERVFADPATALAYFLDVLLWNDEAAIRASPRACYLRLYGAVESLFFYAFDALVGRTPAKLEVVCDEPELLERLEQRFSIDRGGAAIDWSEELHRAVLAYLRLNSLTALRVLSRSSGRITPQIDLPRLVAERAAEAAALVPKVRARVEPAPLPRGLYRRLLESKHGGLGRFVALRNKAAHWMAPVPTALVVELRAYYAGALTELVPRAVESLNALEDSGTSEVRERLGDWSERLLAAARGEQIEDCEPMSYQRSREWASRCLRLRHGRSGDQQQRSQDAEGSHGASTHRTTSWGRLPASPVSPEKYPA